MLLAALAVLAGIVIVASGRGGEMAYEHPDYPPLDLGPVTAADVALLRPPSAAWGYNMRVTDEALTQIARAMSERDVRISALEQRVSDLREELSRGPAPRPGARHRAPGGEEVGGEFTVELPKPVWPPATDIVPAASPAPEVEGQAGDQRSAPRDPADHWAGEHGPADERTQDDVPAGWPAARPGRRRLGGQSAGGQSAAGQSASGQSAGGQSAGGQSAAGQSAGGHRRGGRGARSPGGAAGGTRSRRGTRNTRNTRSRRSTRSTRGRRSTRSTRGRRRTTVRHPRPKLRSRARRKRRPRPKSSPPASLRGPCAPLGRDRAGTAAPGRGRATGTRPVTDGAAVAGPDGRLRCPWGLGAPEYLAYHDDEWGRPLHGDRAIFERLCLEAFQSGLSWLTILRKRENFRAAFAGFDIASVAAFGEDDVRRLMADAGIVRNRAKVAAAIANARAALELPGGLSDLVWKYAREPAAAPADPGRRPGPDTRVEGAVRRASPPRLHVHRPRHRLRDHAGVRHRERPPGRLLLPLSTRP